MEGSIGLIKREDPCAGKIGKPLSACKAKVEKELKELKSKLGTLSDTEFDALAKRAGLQKGSNLYNSLKDANISIRTATNKDHSRQLCYRYLTMGRVYDCEEDVEDNNFSYSQTYEKWIKPVICYRNNSSGKVLNEQEDINTCKEICAIEENPNSALECAQDFIGVFGEFPTYPPSGHVCDGKVADKYLDECNKECGEIASITSNNFGQSPTAVHRKETAMNKCIARFK